jgi:hypothetical protein
MYAAKHGGKARFEVVQTRLPAAGDRTVTLTPSAGASEG